MASRDVSKTTNCLGLVRILVPGYLKVVIVWMMHSRKLGLPTQPYTMRNSRPKYKRGTRTCDSRTFMGKMSYYLGLQLSTGLLGGGSRRSERLPRTGVSHEVFLAIYCAITNTIPCYLVIQLEPNRCVRPRKTNKANNHFTAKDAWISGNKLFIRGSNGYGSYISWTKKIKKTMEVEKKNYMQ